LIPPIAEPRVDDSDVSKTVRLGHKVCKNDRLKNLPIRLKMMGKDDLFSPVLKKYIDKKPSYFKPDIFLIKNLFGLAESCREECKEDANSFISGLTEKSKFKIFHCNFCVPLDPRFYS
jgi:hypothetical protein